MKVFKVLLLIGILIFGIFAFFRFQWGPFGKGGALLVPKGSSMYQIAQDLETQGIVRNAWSFRLLVKWKGAQRNLMAGEYRFEPQSTALEVLRKLESGKRYFNKLVIPEGFNLKQIARRLEKKNLGSEAEIKQLLQSPRLLAKLPKGAPSFEGFLFPATYQYDSYTTSDFLIKEMIQAFYANYDQGMREQAKKLGLSDIEVVTLASIIEKETADPQEREIISSVFHNRLKKGMKLETDPTVIYGLKNFNGDITRADLKNPHPYNTYVHKGLPPGPIASPGKASLMAALNPAKTEFLYFVSKNDGTHYFSKTVNEHEQAVDKYQRSKNSQNSN